MGADLTGVDFGVDASIKGQFQAFAQAGSDLSATAAAALNDVTIACRNIATDLGAAPDDASVAGKTGGDLATAWCDLAVAQIKGNAALQAAGTLTISYDPPHCQASLNAQASCEGNCKVDASCTEPDITARCDPGQLSGTCEATCTGSCEGSVQAACSCQGTCNATCEGTCAGTVSAQVDCDGTCSGNCNGTCNGTNTTAHCDGNCVGKCDANCQVRAGADVKCSGTCTGKCTGSCQMEANATVKCDASCKGGCSVAYKAPKCEATVKPPSCQTDANCQANCNASISAKAECTPPQVTVKASAAVSANLQAQFDAAIRSLEANIPKLLVVFKARGQAFVDSAQAMFSAGGSIAADPGKLNTKGVACAGAIVSAASSAVGNAQVSLQASGKVVGAVGG